ncbi:Ikaros family zinc finger protein [Portunus trituberculatus]|uniref:Ikaros family zinc finger protein n=1 Tax=Portunus trituberculatus TaxID=210409 RepID=A0A5B7FP32_PORTR|nr:Ikaros family zinc finger protein [Portunus trituberculatus]
MCGEAGSGLNTEWVFVLQEPGGNWEAGMLLACLDTEQKCRICVDRWRHKLGGGSSLTGGENNSGSVSRACSVCGHTFSGITWKQKLERHLLVHTGEKPFQCPYCPHRTNRKDALKGHVAALHKVHYIS